MEKKLNGYITMRTVEHDAEDGTSRMCETDTDYVELYDSWVGYRLPSGAISYFPAKDVEYIIVRERESD